MSTPHNLFHLWGYVIISYVIVCLCCTILGAVTYVRFRKSLKRLNLIEQSLEPRSPDDQDEFSLLQHNEIS